MKILGSSCIFPVPDIKKTEEFYVSKLGFDAAEYLNCKEPHICLYKDDAEIILLQSEKNRVIPNRELYGYGYDAYLYTKDPELFEKEFIKKGIKIIRPFNLTDYRNEEAVIEDCDGRLIAFGAKIKTERNLK